MNNSIKRGKDTGKNILRRIKKRDFKDAGGMVVRNSAYQLSKNIVSKIGSLIFTMILARILLPENFGIFSLTISTIIFFSIFSDLGIDNTMSVFISKYLNKKNNKKAKSHLLFLTKIKLILTSIAVFLLLLFSHFLANIYYQKPIFLGLIVGALYLFASSFTQFFESIYIAGNNFKQPLKKEILFQIVRIMLIPLLILFILKRVSSPEMLVFWIVLYIGFSYLLTSIYLTISSRKSLAHLYDAKSKKLTKKEKKRIISVATPLTAMVLSGMFFGYVDTLMLGRFVSEEFIGYYSAAFSLIGSASTLLAFGALGIFPIISKLKSKDLNKILKKTLIISSLISGIVFLITFFCSEPIIKLVYGEAFLPAATYLRYLSVILVIGTINAIYNSYLLAKERTGTMSLLLISTTIINIVLNYFLITSGLKVSMNNAVIGACIATLISKMFYLVGQRIVRARYK